MSTPTSNAGAQSRRLGSLQGWKTSAALPILLTCAAVISLWIIASPGSGGYDAGTLFAYHPILMAVGFMLFTPLGLIAYGLDHPTYKSRWPERRDKRRVHGLLQLAACVFALAGYAAAYIAHEQSGKDHLALERPLLSRQLHVWIGLSALAAMVYQVGTGLWKWWSPTRVFPRHGVAGPWLWLLCLAPFILAAYFRWQQKGYPWVALAFVLCVCVSFVATYAFIVENRRAAALALATLANAEPPEAIAERMGAGRGRIEGHIAATGSLAAAESALTSSALTPSVFSSSLAPGGTAVPRISPNRTPTTGGAAGSGGDEEDEGAKLLGKQVVGAVR